MGFKTESVIPSGPKTIKELRIYHNPRTRATKKAVPLIPGELPTPYIHISGIRTNEIIVTINPMNSIIPPAIKVPIAFAVFFKMVR